jgi:shikimate dehydrogenase
MRVFGLIGAHLGHSFSPRYFAQKFERLGLLTECEYQIWETLDPVGLLHELKENPQVVGANITIPYKETYLPLLDSIDSHARAIGSVNTILFYRSGTQPIATGFNSDWWGFMQSLNEWPTYAQRNGDVPNALILGNGGASKAIRYALEQLQIPAVQFARRPSPGEKLFESFGEYLVDGSLIINCTPLGTYPNVSDAPPIHYELLNSSHLLFDLVYNPEKTEFLERGLQRGAEGINGLQMLQYQADKSWEIWNSSSN